MTAVIVRGAHAATRHLLEMEIRSAECGRIAQTAHAKSARGST